MPVISKDQELSAPHKLSVMVEAETRGMSQIACQNTLTQERDPAKTLQFCSVNSTEKLLGNWRGSNFKMLLDPPCIRSNAKCLMPLFFLTPSEKQRPEGEMNEMFLCSLRWGGPGWLKCSALQALPLPALLSCCEQVLCSLLPLSDTQRGPVAPC